MAVNSPIQASILNSNRSRVVNSELGKNVIKTDLFTPVISNLRVSDNGVESGEVDLSKTELEMRIREA